MHTTNMISNQFGRALGFVKFIKHSHIEPNASVHLMHTGPNTNKNTESHSHLKFTMASKPAHVLIINIKN